MLTAADGKEGFELAKKYLPDVIVTDIMMPIMDGLELCKAVKSNIATSHIPVILLTAKDSLQDKEEGYETGADSYITKPFSAKLLSSRIKNILGARRRLASLISSKIEAKPESKPATETAAPEKEMEHPAATEIKLSKIDEAFLEKFKSIVEERIADPKLDMAFMQESMNMSHSTLYRKLKSLTGMSGNEDKENKPQEGLRDAFRRLQRLRDGLRMWFRPLLFPQLLQSRIRRLPLRVRQKQKQTRAIRERVQDPLPYYLILPT